MSAAPDVGAAASVVRPRVDPSLYADAVGAAAEEESVTDAYPGGDDGFTDAYPDAGSYGPSAGGGGGYDVPLGPMAAADDHGAKAGWSRCRRTRCAPPSARRASTRCPRRRRR